MVRKSEIAFIAALLIVAILFMTQLTVTEQDFQPVDAVDYARVIVGIFTLSVGCLLFNTIRKYRRQMKIAADIPLESPDVRQLKILSNKLVGATFFIFLFYCTMFTVLGYYTTGFIILIAYMHVLYYAQVGKIRLKNSLLLIGLSFGITLSLYCVFSLLFELWLPRGLLV